MKFSLLTSLCAMAAAGHAQQRPNIIIIIADDLGYGDVSAYGAQTIHTPNIDGLAHGGVSFINGYATSATSTPSRYALMTGMYPWKNDNAKILPGDAPLLVDTNQTTLPKLMQQAGYHTAAIGKWHLGMGRGNVDWNTKVAPGANDIGFDYSCLIAATVDRVPTVYLENEYVMGLDKDDPLYVNYDTPFEGEPTALTNPELVKLQWAHGHNNTVVNGIPRIGYMKGGKSAYWDDETMADFFVDKVTKYIGEHKNEPFFLYYGLHEPHVPRTPATRFAGTTTMGARGDVLVEADWCVGEVMKKLEEEGLLDNTIVVFSSDNGPVLNDGYRDEAQERVGEHKMTGGLRGGKYSLFDGGTRVPFFIYWKNHIKPTVSTALVSQLDFLASFGNMVGAKVPEGLDSQNQLDALLGKTQKGRDNLVLEASGRLAMRQGDWIFMPPYKGNETNLTGNELGNLPDYGLFNIAKDKSQQHNLATDKQSKLKKMKHLFLQLTKGYYKEEVEEEVLK